MTPAVLRLFNGLPIHETSGSISFSRHKQVHEETLSMGFLVDDRILDLSRGIMSDLITEIKNNIVTSQDWNKGFYTSWAKIEKTPDWVRRIHQILHYMSTYGAESLGIKSDFMFLPPGELEIPELTDIGLNIFLVRGFTRDELRDKILNMLSSGIALKESTQKDILEVAKGVGIEPNKMLNICKNHEMRIRLCDHFDIVPKDPVEFLRYVVFKTTGTAMIVKSKATWATLSEGRAIEVLEYFRAYKQNHGLNGLASIFYRYKPIFLALRKRPHRELRTIINRIRKLAVKHHKPMPENFLNTVITRAMSGEPYKMQLRKELKEMNLYRHARLMYAVHNRLMDPENVVYLVRNGKSWADKRITTPQDQERLQTVQDIILDSMGKKLNVKGKKILIPNGIYYAMPTSEKNFSGQYPRGTHVRISEGGMVAGVYWEGSRVDLDLSFMDLKGSKIGWDADFGSSDVAYSGDITSAPHGASEVFRFWSDGSKRTVGTLMLNVYSSPNPTSQPYDIVVGGVDTKQGDQKYLIDPNHIIFRASTEAVERQTTIGLVVAEENDYRFYFGEAKVGTGRTSRTTEHGKIQTQFLVNTWRNPILLEKVLEVAGAEIIRGPEEDTDIDLTPNLVTKDTFIDLFNGEV